MARIRILHVSDLHERANRETDTWRRRRVLGDAWMRNLDEIRDDGYPVDLVCFTGDIADWGVEDEYRRASDFVHELLERLEVPIQRFFPVPGNHDVNRQTSADVWTHLRPKILSSSGLDRSRWLAGGPAPAGIDASTLEPVLERRAAYRRWIETSVHRSDLLAERSPHGRLGYRVTVPDLAVRTHVIGLDSAWLCGDDNDQGRLLLTEDQVMRLATRDGDSLDGFRLVLVHHPFAHMADGRSCRELLAPRVDLMLRGHLHKEDLATVLDPDRSMREWAAGCLYEGDNADQWPNACHVIDVEFADEGRLAAFDVRLRGWSTNGHWSDDGSLYRAAPRGRFRWELLPRPRSEPPLPPNRVFVGRDAELQALEEALLRSPAASDVAICALYGMPGVGKTYLAEEFVRQHTDAFPGGVFRLVLPPDRPTSAEALLRDLLDQLRLPAEGSDLVGRLRARLIEPRSLVQIENVDDSSAATAVAVLLATLPGASAIVTGRFHELGRGAGWASIDISTFDQPTAIAFLQAKLEGCPLATHVPELTRLAQTLGHLPLALNLAAGHLRRNMGVDSFISLLRRKGLSLEPADPTDPALIADRARAIIRSSFEISLDDLRDGVAPLADAFASLGYAPPAGFGSSFGAALAGLALGEFEELASTAVSLSLMQPASARPQAWQIHPLIAEFLACQADSDLVTQRAFAWFVERLPPLSPNQAAEQGRMWSEIQAEQAGLVNWLERLSEEGRRAVTAIASSFAIQSGPYRRWQQLYASVAELGIEPPPRSVVLHALAYTSIFAGDFGTSLRAVTEWEQVARQRGDRGGVATALGMRADIAAAHQHFAEAFTIRTQDQIPILQDLGDDRSLGVALGKVARLLEHLGRREEAENLRHDTVLPLLRKSGDPRELAVVLWDGYKGYVAVRRIAEAKDLLQSEILPVFEKLGDRRSYLLGVKDLLRCEAQLGNPQAALERLESKLLPAIDALEDPRSSAMARDAQADILMLMGRKAEAIRVLRETVIPALLRLGDEGEAAVANGTVARLLYEQGSLAAAAEIVREVEIPTYERLDRREALATARTNLATILLDTDDARYREEAAALLNAAGADAAWLRPDQAALLQAQITRLDRMFRAGS